MRKLLTLALCCCTWTTPLAAAPARLGAEAAGRIVDGCEAFAKARGRSQAIAVYDEGGHPIALLRMDGSTPGVTEFAMRKAGAVGLWHFSTAEMAEAIRETPGFADALAVVTVAGGVPVFSADGESFVGAVGVSGGEPLDDAACAEAGIRAAGLSPVRRKAR